jgi:hypothetical protein
LNEKEEEEEEEEKEDVPMLPTLGIFLGGEPNNNLPMPDPPPVGGL